MKSSFAVSMRSIAFSAVAILSTSPALARMEELFGTRSVRACGEPVRSQPSIKEIEALMRCKSEKKYADRIERLEDIKVQAGGTRVYDQFSDSYAT